MPSAAGSLELVAREIASAFVPLRDLTPATAPALFADLGIPLPAATLAQPSFAGALSAAAAAAGTLPGIIDRLTTAFSGSAEDVIAIGAELIAALGVTIGSVSKIADALPGSDLAGKLADWLLIRWLEFATPMLSNGLTLVGLIDRIHDPGVAGDVNHPARVLRTLHVERLGTLLKSPQQLLGDVYGWNKPGFDGAVLLQRLGDVLVDIPYPSTVVTTGAEAPTLVSQFFDLHPTKAPPGLTLTIHLPLNAGLDVPFQLSPTWAFHLMSAVNLVGGTVITVIPPAAISAHAGVALDGQILASITGTPVAPDHAVILVGEAGASRLQAEAVKVALGLAFVWNAATTRAMVEPVIQFEVDGGKLVIDTSSADGFIGAVMSGVNLEAGFDLKASWRPDAGLRFEGSAGIEIDLPLSLALGPVDVKALHVGLGLGAAGDLTLELSVGLGLAIGPVRATIDRLGVQSDLTFPGHGGNLGPIGFGVGFEPPTRVGLSIDAGPVRGGGYMSVSDGLYTGVGSLSVRAGVELTLNVVLIITTAHADAPSDVPRFSLVALATVEFSPGIALFAGFFLGGLGLLVGIHRAMDPAALRAGVKTGLLQTLLFPENPVANAVKVTSDLGRAFPPQNDRYVLGAMAKITYGTGQGQIFEADLGLAVQLGGPFVLAVMAQFRLRWPRVTGKEILVINLDCVGVWDSGKGTLSIDASLVDSRILTWPLSGDAALRAGGKEGFLLSIGGFHPSFRAPAGFPTLERLALTMSAGSFARLRVETYTAITSNTFQIGAHADAFINLKVVTLEGHLAFDALLEFSPFHFEVDLDATLTLKVAGTTLLGLHVDLHVSGPGTWHFTGHVSITILFFKINVGFDATFGSSQPPEVLPPIDAPALLVKALQDRTAWSPSLADGAGTLIVLAPAPAGDAILVHPLGALAVTQREMPLDVEIDRIGASRLAARAQLAIHEARFTGVDPSKMPLTVTPTSGLFAAAQYIDMPDADKLARPSFEPMYAGAVLTPADDSPSAGIERPLVYEVVLDKSVAVGPAAAHVSPLAATAAVMAAHNAWPLPPIPQVTVNERSYTVLHRADLSPADAAAVATSYTRAHQAARRLVSGKPELRGALQIVGENETAGPPPKPQPAPPHGAVIV